ncbi:MAG: DNA-processing protein DprA [Oscillospiraceae bacterium]|jgi:DNA processing protein|nr:DNA-processing protein DprA [Oscillospiraceae bacterium]
MDDALYWVWLQCALGVSSSLRTQDILAAFGGKGENAAERIHAATDYDRRVSGVFTGRQLARLNQAQLSAAESIAEECAQQQMHILTPQSADYPLRLLELVNHPLVLYAKGSLGCLRQHLGIAVVGTRRADRKSIDIAGRLSASLARAGCVIVSGGAMGIDSAAHRGVLSVPGGQTVAVLGCGIRFNYLMENSALRESIAASGAVVSEFPGNTPALAHHFPIRNRIISGMAAGTVVVEAGERSGSLITAECAAEQGRDVFAVPGDAFGSTYTGANKLIRDGAKPVFSAMDVLEEYELIFPELLDMKRAERHLGSSAAPILAPQPAAKERQRRPTAPRKTQQKEPAAAAQPASPPQGLEGTIVALLAKDALHVDAICKSTGERLGAVFTALTNLEMDGLVRQLPGKLYEIATEK